MSFYKIVIPEKELIIFSNSSFEDLEEFQEIYDKLRNIKYPYMNKQKRRETFSDAYKFGLITELAQTLFTEPYLEEYLILIGLGITKLEQIQIYTEGENIPQEYEKFIVLSI